MNLNLKLRVWRQAGPDVPGQFEDYDAPDISDEMSFLEMLDIVNERLIAQDREPIAFDYDCREGICGSCGVMINGQAHGPVPNVATCQLHMRHFKNGDTIIIEPWRSASFPIVKDLAVDRSALDRIIQAGGYVSVSTGSAPDANSILIPKSAADAAMDAAACIGCGACVAACPNGAAQLFTGAKIAHLNRLPQGQPERRQRVLAMVDRMEDYFAGCTNFGECEAACPAGITLDVINAMNRDYLMAQLKS